MLTPNSTCDVCFEEFGEYLQPISITCGHVMCACCCSAVIDIDKVSSESSRSTPCCPFCNESFALADCRLVRVPPSNGGVDGDIVAQSTLKRLSHSTLFPNLQRAAQLALGLSCRHKPDQDNDQDFRHLALDACSLVNCIARKSTFNPVTDVQLSGLVLFLESTATAIRGLLVLDPSCPRSHSAYKAAIQNYRSTLAEFHNSFELNTKLSTHANAALIADELEASNLGIKYPLGSPPDYLPRLFPPMPPRLHSSPVANATLTVDEEADAPKPDIKYPSFPPPDYLLRQFPPTIPPHLHSSHGNPQLHSIGGNQSRVDSSHHTTHTHSGNTTRVIIQDSVVLLGQEKDTDAHQDWRAPKAYEQETLPHASSDSGGRLPSDNRYTDDFTKVWTRSDSSSTPLAPRESDDRYFQSLFHGLRSLEGKVSEAVDNIFKFAAELTRLSGVMEFLQRQIDSEKSKLIKFTGELTRLRAVAEYFRLQSKNDKGVGNNLKVGGDVGVVGNEHMRHASGTTGGHGPGESSLMSCIGVSLASSAL